jgi:hypothetical protein
MNNLKNNVIKNYWEIINAQRDWGKYPNEELVRFVRRTFLKYSRARMKKAVIGE